MVNAYWLIKHDSSLVKIYKRSLSKSRSVFGRISRRDWSDRVAIAVIDRRWFSAGFLVAITVRTKKT